MAEISLHKHLTQREAVSFIRRWLSFRYSTNPTSFVEKNVHYSVYSSPPLVPFLGQFNPVHTLTSYSRCTLTLPSHLHRHLLRRLLASKFPTKMSCAIFISSTVLYAPYYYIQGVHSNLQQYMQSYTRHQSNKTDELLVFIVHLNLHNNFKANADTVQRLPEEKCPVLVFPATLRSVCESMLITVCSAVLLSYYSRLHGNRSFL
jgi:hypothetical protein